ncbi:MAG TPA: EAL domain-containing protein, partial [Pyrinomonadaceae bacterium]|nr:EAL domain-containing protein [Pyrinomonadaceae bacterium]
DVSVNISAKQFTQPDMLERVERVLRETGLDPRRLTLEITESVIMSNADLAAGTLRQLRALGVQLSIDDFGTGYSSLSYLHGFPANTLKIDRSFVSKMTGGNESAAIVETIITLASKLRMNVVAEGLETAEQKAQLLELGCEHGQGYLFSKPVDARAADRLLQEKAQWLAAPAPTTFGTHDGAELLM